MDRQTQFMYVPLNRMSWLLRGRELILGAYSHLPNIFIMGSLLVGAITGIVPILILGLVSSFLGVLIYIIQLLMNDTFKDLKSSLGIFKQIYPATLDSSNKLGPPEVLISSWSTMASFIIAYLFFNALYVYSYKNPNVRDENLIANRQAYMMSIMIALSIISIIFITTRISIGFETFIMGPLSVFFGVGMAWALWNLVTLNGKDLRMGDVFQVRVNMIANNPSGGVTPIACVPPENSTIASTYVRGPAYTSAQ